MVAVCTALSQAGREQTIRTYSLWYCPSYTSHEAPGLLSYYVHSGSKVYRACCLVQGEKERPRKCTSARLLTNFVISTQTANIARSQVLQSAPESESQAPPADRRRGTFFPHQASGRYDWGEGKVLKRLATFGR